MNIRIIVREQVEGLINSQKSYLMTSLKKMIREIIYEEGASMGNIFITSQLQRQTQSQTNAQTQGGLNLKDAQKKKEQEEGQPETTNTISSDAPKTQVATSQVDSNNGQSQVNYKRNL